MNEKKIGKIRLYYVIFMTAVYTLWSCTKIIIGSYLVKNYRPYIDRIIKKWGQRLMGLTGAKIIVSGNEHIENIEKNRRVIVMCNHSSVYDVAVVAMALNTSFRFVAKKELYRIHIFGTSIRKAEFISIDRQNHEQALKDLEEAKAKMLDGITLWMAPEGTRSDDGKLKKFKRGAFHIAIDTQAIIVPMVVKDVHEVQAGTVIDVYPNRTVHVEICSPIDAAEFTIDKRIELVSIVRGSMLQALGQKEDE
ncbi:MAG: 1-acyl-sn-glycerol-3-phosphate acyltransferase [Kangiellaceae bacterium]|nr:1-acyl-sn-glycerol-3-phosphate acyltransferase [Kangiellaceae bacterium]